jgi:5,6-dimethylbenzimidazole synthase
VRAEPPGDLFEGLSALVRWRRDVRRFERKPIATELRMQIGALADAVPSVGLSQPWRVIQVENLETQKKVEQSLWLVTSTLSRATRAPKGNTMRS